jgi:hypothetical protein
VSRLGGQRRGGGSEIDEQRLPVVANSSSPRCTPPSVPAPGCVSCQCGDRRGGVVVSGAHLDRTGVVRKLPEQTIGLSRWRRKIEQLMLQLLCFGLGG